MAGTLLTTTAVTTMGVPAAYAEGDDYDDDNGDGNKQKVEEESAGSLADCDDNEVERAGFECFAIAELSEGGGPGITTSATTTDTPPDTTTDTPPDTTTTAVAGTEIMDNPLFNLADALGEQP